MLTEEQVAFRELTRNFTVRHWFRGNRQSTQRADFWSGGVQANEVIPVAAKYDRSMEVRRGFRRRTLYRLLVLFVEELIATVGLTYSTPGS